MKDKNYDGWELKYFDNANNFRNYQNSLFIKFVKGLTAEIGPGNGKNLDLYYHKIDETHLYEPTIKLSKRLKKKFVKKKNVKILNRIFNVKKNFYDTIIYLDVIEHIHDYKNEINKAYVSLKKNGFLIINVPAFQFLYSDFDKDIGHIKRFEKKDFIKLCNELNIKNYNLKYYDSIGFFLSFISKLFVKNYRKNFGFKINVWNKLIYISKLLDSLLFNQIGKSLILVINKK